MSAVATLVEFLGFEPPTNSLTDWEFTREPRFRFRSLTNSATVWDGQTLVLGGPTAGTGHLLVFITPTLITPTGYRVHTDQEVAQAGAAQTK